MFKLKLILSKITIFLDDVISFEYTSVDLHEICHIFL